VDPRRLHAPSDGADMLPRIREAVAEAHGIQLHAIALVSPGALPKTTSGKPRRYLCREAWIEGTLQPIAEWCEATRPAAVVGS
jgi:acyl-CoA synthetase (AMP-forming)/AMP-acid ligase II